MNPSGSHVVCSESARHVSPAHRECISLVQTASSPRFKNILVKAVAAPGRSRDDRCANTSWVPSSDLMVAQFHIPVCPSSRKITIVFLFHMVAAPAQVCQLHSSHQVNISSVVAVLQTMPWLCVRGPGLPQYQNSLSHPL